MSIKQLFFKTNTMGTTSLSEDRTLEFRRIYDEHQFYVRKTVFWIVGPDFVDDVVQEIFINVWKQIHKFRGSSSIKTWIYRISINTSLSFLRKNKRHQVTQPLEEDVVPSELKNSDPLVEKLIEKGIYQLKEKQKLVFILFYKQELSVKEIAEILKVPEGTVKSRLHNSRDDFKSFLLKHGVSYE